MSEFNQTEDEALEPPPRGHDNRRWSAKKMAAFKRLVETEETYPQIAKAIGSTPRTIKSWMDEPAFYAKVKDGREQIIQAIIKRGIREKANRLDHLQQLYDNILETVAERGKWIGHEATPGWEKGWLVCKHVSGGRNYAIDNRTIQTLLDIQKQAAIELNEWNNTATLDINVIGKVDESITDLIEKLYAPQKEQGLLTEAEIIDVLPEE